MKSQLRFIFQKHIFLGLILLDIFILCTAAVFATKRATSSSVLLHPAKVHQVTIALSPPPTFVPTATASPTAILTPKPVYTGYCMDVPVLMYHHTAPRSIAVARGQTSLNVDNGFLEQQMAYISTHGFTSYTALDLINALRTHTTLPGKPIVITLDDGYDDVYSYAFPIFKKYNLKFNLMVPTGLLGNTSPGNSYYSWSQLKEMVGSGLGFVSNHTWSHSTMGGTAQKDEFEIATSQKQFGDVIGITPLTFAYPYGAGIYPQVIALLQRHGFLGAFSTIPGKIQCDSFIMSLHRTRVGNAPITAYGIY